MKFGKKESIQKLDQCPALFQIHLMVTLDLWRRILPRKSVTVKLAHGSACLSSPSWGVLQVAMMHQAGTVVNHIAEDWENERWTSFSHPAFCVWSVISWQYQALKRKLLAILTLCQPSSFLTLTAGKFGTKTTCKKLTYLFGVLTGVLFRRCDPLPKPSIWRLHRRLKKQRSQS